MHLKGSQMTISSVRDAVLVSSNPLWLPPPPPALLGIEAAQEEPREWLQEPRRHYQQPASPRLSMHRVLILRRVQERPGAQGLLS